VIQPLGNLFSCGKVQVAGAILLDSRQATNTLGHRIAVGRGSVAISSWPFQIGSAGQADESFHLLQTLHRVHHLVSGLVLFDLPVPEQILTFALYSPRMAHGCKSFPVLTCVQRGRSMTGSADPLSRYGRCGRRGIQA
jgi:hypothetical protein